MPIFSAASRAPPSINADFGRSSGPVEWRIGVSIQNRHTTVTWTPYALASSRNDMDMPTTACFTVTYGAMYAGAVSPAIDAVLTMWPERRLAMTGYAAWMPWMT